MLLARLRAVDKIDFSRVVVDSSSIRAIGAGEKLVRTHRSCTTRHHLASNGTCIVAILTGANRSHVTRLVPLIEATSCRSAAGAGGL